jgi:hypothetical protein
METILVLGIPVFELVILGVMVITTLYLGDTGMPRGMRVVFNILYCIIAAVPMVINFKEWWFWPFPLTLAVILIAVSWKLKFGCYLNYLLLGMLSISTMVILNTPWWGWLIQVLVLIIFGLLIFSMKFGEAASCVDD